MVTIALEGQQVSVPEWVVDLESFRRWVHGDDVPEHWRIWWLDRDVWMDMSKEQIFSHAVVKTEIGSVLHGLVKTAKLGLHVVDGLMISSFAGDYAGVPDGVFVSTSTLGSDRVRLIEGSRGGYVELQGTPDMVLEVVSTSSLQKDTVVLRNRYWLAGIPEYWVVDARRDSKFDILRSTSNGYVATRKQDGWIKSQVFGKSFRLTKATNALGHPEYTLEVR
jgi:hypothetical protein